MLWGKTVFRRTKKTQQPMTYPEIEQKDLCEENYKALLKVIKCYKDNNTDANSSPPCPNLLINLM